MNNKQSNRNSFHQFRRFGKVILIPVCISMLMCGCGSTKTERQGSAIGAGTGAVIGGVVGGLLGGRTGALVGTAAGVTVGTIVGQDWAKRVEKRRAKAKTEEGRIQASIDESRKIQAEASALNQKLAAEIERKKLLVASLKEKYTKDQTVSAEFRNQAAELKKQAEAAAAKRAELEKVIEMVYQDIDTEEKKRNLTQESFQALSKEVNALQDEVAALRLREQELLRLQGELSI